MRGSNRLPFIHKGLDKMLLKKVVFSYLNPDLDDYPHLDFPYDIARHQDLRAIPWLEGGNQLSHLQPRVRLLMVRLN